ncbi:MAG: SpoIIE family protein phosphatase [Bacteroidota bacterium]
MPLLRSLILLFNLLLCSIALTQYDIEHYTVDHGLMSNNTRGIWQDTTGHIWLVDEYGFNRSNGKSIESFPGKKKYFEFGKNLHYQKSGDTLFYQYNQFFHDGSYGTVKTDGKSFYKQAELKFSQDGEVIDSIGILQNYGWLSSNRSSFFYFNITDGSFYLRHHEQQKELFDIDDLGSLIPTNININDLIGDEKYTFSTIFKYVPWFFDNNGRFYLKIHGNRIVRFDKQFKTDTIKNVPYNFVKAFKTPSGRELFFSLQKQFRCFEYDGEALAEIDRTQAFSDKKFKIRALNGIIYIGDNKHLYQLKNDKLHMVKDHIVDFEISPHNTLFYITQSEKSGVFQLKDLEHDKAIIERIQPAKISRRPSLFRDREKNLWIASGNGFYKVAKDNLSSQLFTSREGFEPLIFDSSTFIFSRRAHGNTKLKNLRRDSASLNHFVLPAFNDHNFAWLNILDYKNADKKGVDLIKLDKENLNYSRVHLTNLEWKPADFYIPSNFKEYFSLGNSVFKITEGHLEKIYRDKEDSCFLHFNGYQYSKEHFFGVNNFSHNQITPNYLLISKNHHSTRNSDPGNKGSKPEKDYLLFNTRNNEVKPFTFDHKNNEVLLSVILNKNKHCYFVREATKNKEDTTAIKVFILESDELIKVKEINPAVIKGIDSRDKLIFKTKNFFWFRNKSKELMYFDFATHELGKFQTDKINVALLHDVFATSDEDVIYVNDLNRSYLLDFSNFKDDNSVAIKKTFDFNASGFWETQDQFYFGRSDELLSMDKNYEPPIDDFPLYLDSIQVLDRQFKPIGENMYDNTSFSHDQNNVVFHLTPLSHYKSASISLRYKLDGSHQMNWRNSSSDSIAFENLSPGHYRFKVKAMNEDGIKSNMIEYSFAIHPPFWQTWTFRIAIGLVLIVGLYTIYQLRLRKLRRREKYLERRVDDRTKEVVEQKEQAENQRSLVEQKNNEILDSITYAKRLQDAILPSPKIVSAYLVDSFIFYRPKDIVAGDFYFMDVIEESNRKLVFYAAADCTGHGVPGAMVSIVGANGLKRCIQEFELRETGKILDKLAQLVADNFAQSEEQIRDGMDLALCCLEIVDGSIQKVYFSGAHNPLWIVNPNRKTPPKNAIPFKEGGGFEIKANKQAIGYSENITPFDTTVFEVEEGDILYTFSDGFADQFGGPKYKKYKSAKFKRFLVSIHKHSIDRQKELLVREFEAWKKDTDQVDDVCVIGVSM